MKRLIISMSILLIVSFGLVSTLAGAEDKKFRPAGKDPNAVKVEIKSSAVPRQTPGQRRSRIEGRMNSVKTMHNDLISELKSIRKLAVEEGAVKTAERIDRLLTSRTKRFDGMIKRMEERWKDRGQGRSMRSRDQLRKNREDRIQRRRPAKRDIKTQDEIGD